MGKVIKRALIAMLFLIVFPMPSFAALDCPISEIVELDWSTRDWPDPVNPAGDGNYTATLSHTEFNVGGVDFAFAFTSDAPIADFIRSMEDAADIVPAVASPNDVNTIVSPSGGEEGLSMTVNPLDVAGNPIDLDITMTMLLSTAIDELEFTMSDIDGSGTRQDQMTVLGFNGGVPVTPTLSYLTSAATSVYTIAGNVATASGNQNVSPANGNADEGTVVVSFSQPVDEVRVIYADANEVPGSVGGLRGTTMGNTFKICKNADLSITKTDNVADAEVGDTLNYAIEVSNAGPHDSGTGVTISDTLPGDITVNGGAAGPAALTGTNASDWSCNSNAATPQVITCSFIGASPTGLLINTTSAFTFVTDPLPASVFQTTITNTVEVIRDPDVPDPDPDNNDATHDTPIIGALLTLVKVIDNTGGGTATVSNFVLSTAGPEPISGTSGSSSVTEVPVDAGIYTLTETSLPNYIASAWVCVDVNAQGGNKIRLLESNNGVCTITNTFDSPPEVDLKITKAVSDNEPQVGSTVTFTLTIENIGPDDATNVDITDIVPAGFTYIGSSIAGGDSQDDSDPTGAGLEWIINSFLAGDPAVVLTFQAIANTP